MLLLSFSKTRGVRWVSFHTIEKLAAGATVGFYFTDWDYTGTRITTCFFSGYKVG